MDEFSQALADMIGPRLPSGVLGILQEDRMTQKAAILERIKQDRANAYREAEMVEGLGQLDLSLPQDVFMEEAMCPVNQATYGPNPWANPKFRRKVWAEYPQYRVAVRKKTVVTHPGLVLQDTEEPKPSKGSA